MFEKIKMNEQQANKKKLSTKRKEDLMVKLNDFDKFKFSTIKHRSDLCSWKWIRIKWGKGEISREKCYDESDTILRNVQPKKKKKINKINQNTQNVHHSELWSWRSAKKWQGDILDDVERFSKRFLVVYIQDEEKKNVSKMFNTFAFTPLSHRANKQANYT